MLHKDTSTQHVDANVSAAVMRDLTPEGRLLVHSCFATWQGEAPYVGRPAVFLRLGGCNRGSKTAEVGCVGCDTDFRVARSAPMPVDMVADLVIGAMKEHRTRLVVITGGEPLLQSNGLVSLMLSVLNKTRGASGAPKVHFQIETNGDLLGAFDDALCGDNMMAYISSLTGKSLFDLRMSVVISPKATLGRFKLPASDSFPNVRALSTRVVVRQVISGDLDSPYWHLPEGLEQWAEINCRTGIDDDGFDEPNVYLSPMTLYDAQGQPRFDEASVARAVRLANHCNFGLSLQTHIVFKVE